MDYLSLVLALLCVALALALLVNRKYSKPVEAKICSNESVCRRFDRIRLHSQCQYAHKAKTYGAPAWERELSIEQNLTSFLPTLRHYIEVHKNDEIDAYIVEITDERLGETTQAVDQLLNRVLRYFEELELKEREQRTGVARASDAKKKRITSDYGVTFARTRLFLTPFAPCFPETSSRYAFGEQHSTFLLLQSSHSFQLLNRLADNQWDKVIALRDKVRENFIKAGRPYQACFEQ